MTACVPEDRPRLSSLTRTALIAVPVLAIAFVSYNSEDERAYCADNTDEVVDEHYCDDDYGTHGGGYFWVYPGAGRIYRPGDHVDPYATHRSAALVKVGGGGKSGFGGTGRTISSRGIHIGFGG